MAQARRITIRELLAAQGEIARMRLLVGEAGLDRYIDHPRMQKPSLAFAGFIDNLSDYRLQVVGKTELDYLATRSTEEQKKAVDAVFDLRLAGVVITRGQEPPAIILEAARRTDTPLLVSELPSSTFMTNMMLYLSQRLAPVVYQHGVYMDIFGLGVLITGSSGIGKSEVGLELISRGSRLIADDMVEFSRKGPTAIVGRSPDTLRYHMEIRGLGILNIRDLYGAAAITDAKRLSLVVELVPWDQVAAEDRVLGEDSETEILEVSIARVPIPIRTGRSLAVLVEVAARNQLLKQRGIHSGEAFVKSLQERIRKGS
ncbi:Hpr(Ser) kinase/phosphatase [Mariprofundus ferrinatatus]|uniref:HPr kinase/phosphorylase n=1 Tax=Mariprofundus ferrinatatus TaxID=1921087 RepID=A0A2K8L185_9PROT|nr:HPr(Ser) kinase/phosphatase [Mariprofundus ferrinatatus]ATX81003.1 Hpr(Ser) kinase/phosphatase [Mariprofundus ferrinatatus]